MRWSTVCGEMSSSAAISLDDRCSLTRRRQSSCPALSRAIRASISSPAELSSPSAVSGTRGHSSKANPTPNAMALLSITSPALNLFHNGEVSQISADFRELSRKGIGGAYSWTLWPAFAEASAGSLRNTFSAGMPAAASAKAGGEGWIRTSVRLRGQIYSLLPLTTRPPLQRCGQARHVASHLICVNAGKNEELSPRRFAPALQPNASPPDWPGWSG